MTDADKLFEKLEQTQKLYGLTGVFIVIVLIIVAVLLWKYLTKTVENQAKITFDKELVDYNKGVQKELARLNNELETITARQIGNIDSEREAILEYLNAYSHWLYGSLEIDIVSFKYNNFEDINEVLRNMREAYSKCNQSWNKLKFWATDQAIVTASHELNSTILKFSHYHEATLGKLRHNLSWGKMYSDQFQSIIGKIKEVREWAEFLATEDERLRGENDKILKEYWVGRTDLFKNVVTKNDIFQDLARKYLNHKK